MSENISMVYVFYWAMDFCRALNERHPILKRLFRIVIGKYAMREFYGIWQALEKAGEEPSMSYGCEGCGYHKEEIPKEWWIAEDEE